MQPNARRWRTPRHAVLVALSLLLVLLLAACGSSGGGGGGGGGSTEPPPPEPPPEPTYTSPGRYIDVTGDRSIVVTASGDTATIEAVVRDVETNAVASGAVISYATSNAAVATVSASGVVTATTDIATSAEITLSADDAFDVVVSVVSLDLTASATFLPSSDVVAYDPSAGTLTLSLNGTTGGMGAGDVVLSGERAGVLAEIQSETARSVDTVTFSVTEATLLDAVAAMDADVRGPAVRGVARVEEGGVTIYSTAGTPIATAAVGGFSCETDRGEGVAVDIDGSYLDYDVSFSPVVSLATSGLSVQRFELSVDGTATLDARSGTLTLRSDLNAEVTCERELSTFPLAFVPVVGPLGFAPTVTPAFGFEASADANIGQIAITGPSVDLGVDATAGVRYLDGVGFSTIAEYRRIGEGVSWGTYDGDLDASFEAKVEPFLKLTFAASANLGPRALASFGIAEIKAGGGAELALQGPLNPLDRGYTGPVWSFKATGSGGLGPLLENVQTGVGPLLEFLGIDADLTTIDADLFTFDRTLTESPKPQAEGTIGTSPRAEMSLVAADAASSGTVQFVGWVGATNPGTAVATATTVRGNAHARWYPVGAQRTITEIRARSYAAPFGVAGLPYAGGAAWVFSQDVVPNRVFVEVKERDDVDPGETVPNWLAFDEETIDPSIGEIVVEWNDGNVDRRVTVARDPDPEYGIVFEAEIDTTFGESGLQYQVVTITEPDGTFIDDRHVPVLVGAPFERVTDVTYLPSVNIVFGNDEGASQDFSTLAGPDADFYVVRGRTYRIRNVTDPAVDLWIKTADLSGSAFAVDPFDYATLRNGAFADRIRFTVPMDAPNILYYRSDTAPEMGGVFYVLDE